MNRLMKKRMCTYVIIFMFCDKKDQCTAVSLYFYLYQMLIITSIVKDTSSPITSFVTKINEI